MNVERQAVAVSNAFYDWLAAEVVTSGEGRNKYLDAKVEKTEDAKKRFSDLRRRIALPYDNEENWNAQKDKGHRNRWPFWLEAAEITSDGDSQADFASARLLFAPLMTISGAYRMQSYLESDDPEEYLARRSEVIGVDMEDVVASQISERVPGLEFSAAQISFDSLKKRFDYAYGQNEVAIRAMAARLGSGTDDINGESLSVRSMMRSQIDYLKLATDCVLLAAKLRHGKPGMVPFLEPVSISDQSGEVYYPLAEPVDWHKVLAA
jgi:hypothetical protein